MILSERAKLIVRLGALAAAVVAISGFVSWGYGLAKPIAETDPGPWASIYRVATTTDSLAKTLQAVQRQADSDRRNNTSSNCLLYRNLAAKAEARLAQHPADASAHADVDLFGSFRDQWCSGK